MYHGLRKFMTRGIEKAQKRSYMIASVQNLKRLLGNINRTVKKALQILNDLQGNLFLPTNFNICVVNINKK